MEEKNTYDGRYEISISLNKIWDNIVRYWWICLLCFLASVLAAFGLAYRSYQSTKASLKAEMDAQQAAVDSMIRNGDDQLKYVYVAKSTIYMARETIDLQALTGGTPVLDGTYLEENPNYIEIYKEQVVANLESTFVAMDKTLLYDCMALLYTNSVMDELNQKLTAAGYGEYDSNYDVINITLGNNARFYTLSLTDKDAARAEFIIKTATDILISRTTDILGISYSRIVDQADSREYLDWYGTHILASEKMVAQKTRELAGIIAERRQPYHAAAAKYDSYRLLQDNLLSMKSILIVFLGIFLGLGIIFVCILFDTRIRSREEAELYFEQPVLDEINVKQKDEIQYGVMAAVLDRRCAAGGVRSLLITGTENGDITKQFAERLSEELKRIGKACTLIHVDPADSDVEKKIESAKKKEGLLLINAANINKSSQAVLAAGLVDSVLYAITANRENMKQAGRSLSHIKIAGGKVLGSILIKSGRIFR